MAPQPAVIPDERQALRRPHQHARRRPDADEDLLGVLGAAVEAEQRHPRERHAGRDGPGRHAERRRLAQLGQRAGGPPPAARVDLHALAQAVERAGGREERAVGRAEGAVEEADVDDGGEGYFGAGLRLVDGDGGQGEVVGVGAAGRVGAGVVGQRASGEVAAGVAAVGPAVLGREGLLVVGGELIAAPFDVEGEAQDAEEVDQGHDVGDVLCGELELSRVASFEGGDCYGFDANVRVDGITDCEPVLREHHWR